MPSRREFLTTVAALAAAGAGSAARAAGLLQAGKDIKTALNAPVGLQLWSLRKSLPQDLAGSLAKVRAMGFREVEGAGTWKHTAAEMRAALDAAGLRCQSIHAGFEDLRDHPDRVHDEAKAVGATMIVCPWAPHDDKTGFTREVALTTAEAFNTFGRASKESGFRFAYHCHGYEFVPSTEGTLFDTIAANTDPALVSFQMDVFHALFGGADPVALITKYKDRVTSLHLKDLKKGFPIKAGTAVAPAEADVPLGTGQVDMAATLRAAMKSAATIYYVEDESAAPLEHIPRSVAYLESFKP